MAEALEDWRTDEADSPWDGTHLSTLRTDMEAQDGEEEAG